MVTNNYDLVVIGSGPAGQKGAIAAAKLGKRVAIVDREEMIGGVCLQTGTIPSKAVREAILYLTGFRQRAFYGQDYSVKQDISVADLSARVSRVRANERAVIKSQLNRNNVTTFNGKARFVDPYSLEIEGNGRSEILTASRVLIACGTRAARAPEIPFGKSVLDADQVGQIERIPRELIVVGAGVIGLEYASMLTALNVKVTVIDQKPTILDFVDHEITEALSSQMRRQGVVFRLGEKVTKVEIDEFGMVQTRLESGKRVRAQGLLYAVGRQSNTDLLNLQAAGLSADSRGRLTVNEHFQTQAPHIYAAGDCIGFPALASTSMEQGRLAAAHMFNGLAPARHYPMPYGIYTIPEISMIGKTERELTEARIPYEVGIARYNEVAKGQIVGDETGMLKILFHPDTLKLFGVHVIGESAAEIIHIGQTVLALEAPLNFSGTASSTTRPLQRLTRWLH